MKPFTLRKDWERERIALIKGHRRSENDVRDLREEIGSLPLANNARHSPTRFEVIGCLTDLLTWHYLKLVQAKN